jgi:hypothetical protein
LTGKHLIRDTDGWDSIELLLVSAVASILAIRGYLALAGYPRLAWGQTHIAHMLWGGILMLVALLLLLVYWNPPMRRFSAFVGGVGFGTFIDELGKFITSDNDYFYKPTVALLYVIFILTFLLTRALLGNEPLSWHERRVNAELRRHLPERETFFSARIAGYFSLRRRLREFYRRIVLGRWFREALTVFFVILGLSGMAVVIRNVMDGWPVIPSIPVYELIASGAALVCIWIGTVRLRASRLNAYIWFKRSVLVNIYVTQVFMLYDSQFSALLGLLGYILLYLALRYMIASEEELET